MTYVTPVPGFATGCSLTTMSRTDQATALRGHVVSFDGDPFATDRPAETLREWADGLVVVRDGVITAVGDFAELGPGLGPDVAVEHHPGRLVTAGFVDCHVHYPQLGIVAAPGAQLIDWLGRYVFPEEARFADADHARRTADAFLDQCLAAGTTTALVFGTVHPDSVDAFFAAALERGLRMVAGKVLMDRNAPDALLDTAQRGYDESRAAIERWHGRGRLGYAITPRFAPTSSPAQLEAAGALRAEHPGTWVHSHVSENLDEIAWVRSLFPDRAGYLDVYDHYGLLGRRSVLAHGVHLTGAELARCAESGTVLAHCPTSNLFLGSGLFDLAAAAGHGVGVGLGTDVGAGTSLSLLRTVEEAYKVAALRGAPLDAVRAFYLATLGGARALDLDDRIGSVTVGKEADLVVLDPGATPMLAERAARAASVAELLFALELLGDERAVAATYVAGRRVAGATRG